jgi:hypothetical protein
MVRVISSAASVPNPLDLAEQALRASGLPLRDIRRDPAQNSVTARTEASLLSWGETVEVSVDSHGFGTVFRIRSRTPQPVTWGKNEKNEVAIAAALGPLVP